MTRITIKNLRRLCETLNKITGSPTTPYTRLEDGTLRGNIGHFYIDCAYGGYSLERMLETGGCTVIFNCGHVPARDLYNRIHAFIAALDMVSAGSLNTYKLEKKQ